MKKLLTVPEKTCVTCGKTFSRRKPSGGLTSIADWNARRCCSRRCHVMLVWVGRKIPLEERFWPKVDKRGPDECWVYQGGLRDKRGYGCFYIQPGKMIGAHRMAYILTHGKLADSMYVRLMCDAPQKRCCNPAHMIVGPYPSVGKTPADIRRWKLLTRDKRSGTKVTTAELAKLQHEYAALPCGPSQKYKKNGVVTALARKYNITPTHLCHLVQV